MLSAQEKIFQELVCSYGEYDKEVRDTMNEIYQTILWRLIENGEDTIISSSRVTPQIACLNLETLDITVRDINESGPGWKIENRSLRHLSITFNTLLSQDLIEYIKIVEKKGIELWKSYVFDNINIHIGNPIESIGIKPRDPGENEIIKAIDIVENYHESLVKVNVVDAEYGANFLRSVCVFMEED